MMRAMAKRKDQATAEEEALIRALGPPPGGPATPEEWERELNRRLHEIVNGTARTVDAHEATERIFAGLRRRRGSR